MKQEKKQVLKRLDSAKILSQFMDDYYYSLDEAKPFGKQKIAWFTSVGPVELLRGMRFQIYFTGAHSAMMGTTRLELFNCDDILYNNARTCPNNANCLYGMPQRLFKKTGISFLIIDAVLNDLRCLSHAQARTNIEVFIEQLEETN